MNQKPYILILNGSPRELGNTTALATQLAEGARVAGAEVEHFFLQNLKLEPCNACDSCKEATPGECIIEDDMQQLYPHLRRAAAIVIASPVYWFTFCAQVKLCIDRWYALETDQGNALSGKRFALLLVYGDSDPYASGGINAIHTFQDMCRYLECPIIGIVHASANDIGDIQKQPQVLQRAFKLGQKLVTPA